jgi:alkylhydroperoxidase/carboxymuconolactone decarboxylase family protein YurZ
MNNESTATLDENILLRFRSAFDPNRMSSANVAALARAHPKMRAWAEETTATFFGPTSVLSARDRERCIIALLVGTGTPLSLAVHIYWGLMEGITLEEVRETIALVVCYAGLPRCAQGLLVLDRVSRVLVDAAEVNMVAPEDVLQTLVEAFGPAAVVPIRTS